MMDAIRDFYSDGAEHSNQELYAYFRELIGDDDLKTQNHNLRGCQQTLKRAGELINVGHGIWQAA